MLLYRLSRVISAIFLSTNIFTIISATAIYAVVSYVLMAIAGEKDLIALDNFFYWLVVTASTVGYGDYSPTTAFGKLAASLWVIPLGLSLFALVLTRAGIYLSDFILKGKKGLRMIQSQNHSVIIGWNAARTLRLIELLLSKTNMQSERIVLCVDVDIDNPMPERIDFVKVDSFSHSDTMKRANLAEASRIIIDTPMDDVTLTTALYCQKVSPNSHKTAYFQDEEVGDLLQGHSPNIEIIPSVSVEMLARSSLDPGSALLHKQLLDSTYGMTQYCVTYDKDDTRKFDELFKHFKQTLNATLIGVKHEDKPYIDLNPELDLVIEKGDVLYYIAAKRLEHNRCFSL